MLFSSSIMVFVQPPFRIICQFIIESHGSLVLRPDEPGRFLFFFVAGVFRIAAFACQSGAGAEKAFAKLKDALGVQELAAELILIDPKAKPSEENERKIKQFCEKLNNG